MGHLNSKFQSVLYVHFYTPTRTMHAMVTWGGWCGMGVAELTNQSAFLAPIYTQASDGKAKGALPGRFVRPANYENDPNIFSLLTCGLY